MKYYCPNCEEELEDILEIDGNEFSCPGCWELLKIKEIRGGFEIVLSD